MSPSCAMKEFMLSHISFQHERFQQVELLLKVYFNSGYVSTRLRKDELHKECPVPMAGHFKSYNNCYR